MEGDIRVIPIVALLASALAPSAQAAAASGGHVTRANPPVHAYCSGWSYTPPSQCGHPNLHQIHATSYRNDDGCSGYNESGEMMCKATTHDVRHSRGDPQRLLGRKQRVRP
jgi:hypothetical protein